MPLKINVPYSEKDLAKEKGAFWDKDNPKIRKQSQWQSQLQ